MQVWNVTFEIDEGFCGAWTKEMIEDFLKNAIEGLDGIKAVKIEEDYNPQDTGG